MNSAEFSKTIALDPRAVVFTGSLAERTKNSDAGQISGYAPHYTVKGCPLLQFDAGSSMIPSFAEGSAIEADFKEQARPEMAAFFSAYGRPLNMVHLAFGRQGVPPNAAEAKVLKEASEIFREINGQPVFLVALPILSSAAYGVAAGRLAPIGVFRQSGEALWLHPGAVGVFLKASYPVNQSQRSTTAVTAPAAAPAAPAIDWYGMMSTSLGKSTKLTGAKLHNLVISSYADQLMIQGKKSNKADALAQAKLDYDTLKGTNSEPLPKTPAKPAQKLTSARV